MDNGNMKAMMFVIQDVARYLS